VSQRAHNAKMPVYTVIDVNVPVKPLYTGCLYPAGQVLTFEREL